ncbi:hypothetical protein ABTM92_19655, partial [Acinetobacter baumannii]
IEMLFRISVKEGEALVIKPLGLNIPPTSPALWGVALVLLIGGGFLFRLTWPMVSNAWGRATSEGGAA